MKGVFRPMVPLQAQLWSVTLLGENISFTLWCLFCYKKASPGLKIDPLVWNSGRMELTLSGPQMLKTTFIFHSGHVTTCCSLTLMKTLSAASAFQQLNALRKHRKKEIDGLACLLTHGASVEHIAQDMSADFISLTLLGAACIVKWYYQEWYFSCCSLRETEKPYTPVTVLCICPAFQFCRKSFCSRYSKKWCCIIIMWTVQSRNFVTVTMEYCRTEFECSFPNKSNVSLLHLSLD